MSLVIITGASRGIGAAIARAFSKTKQHRLCLVARNEKLLQDLKKECSDAGTPTEYFCCEMRNNDEVISTAQKILQQCGTPRVIVNNSGFYDAGSLLTTTPEHLQEMMQINCLAPVNFTRVFLPSMIEQKAGDIFCMGSVASIQGYNDCGAYTIAKHALLGYSRALREETKAHHLRVTCLMPGGVYTDSWSGTNIDSERLMKTEDVANTIVAIQQLSQQTVVEEIILRPQLGDV